MRPWQYRQRQLVFPFERQLESEIRCRNTVISLGINYPPTEEQVEEAGRILRRRYPKHSPETFSFLSRVSFQKAFAYMRGLVAGEQNRITGGCGSVSSVIPAFRALQTREMTEWSRIASWIVLNHDNPWSPFGFQKQRTFWEQAMREAEFRDFEDVDKFMPLNAFAVAQRESKRKRNIAMRHNARTHLQRLHRHSPPPSQELRDMIVAEIEADVG
jgi:hypothetical protein